MLSNDRRDIMLDGSSFSFLVFFSLAKPLEVSILLFNVDDFFFIIFPRTELTG